MGLRAVTEGGAFLGVIVHSVFAAFLRFLSCAFVRVMVQWEHTPVHGVASKTSKLFDDSPMIRKQTDWRLEKIKVWYSDYIDAIQFSYVVAGQKMAGLPHGRLAEHEREFVTFELQPEEGLLAMRGAYERTAATECNFTRLEFVTTIDTKVVEGCASRRTMPEYFALKLPFATNLVCIMGAEGPGLHRVGLSYLDLEVWLGQDKVNEHCAIFHIHHSSTPELRYYLVSLCI